MFASLFTTKGNKRFVVSICHLFLLVGKTENFPSLKLLMFVSIQPKGTSAHERRQVTTVYINIMLHLLQYLTGIQQWKL